ncbi:hypothetical protein OXX80_005347 [Metschnikowia pulcherrima]
MSSFQTIAEESWRNPDICDIVSPKPDTTPQFDAYNPVNNYIIPGFNPQSIPQPENAASGHWSSPAEEVYFDEIGKTPAQYYNNNGQEANGNVARFETESSSSHSSVTNASVGRSASGADKEKTKSRKPRGKVLNDDEAELINKDDSLLTEEQLVIKRKAQNRLAQRAFRERKESKLKELQQKLLESEGERRRLLEVLDEVKQQFISVKTENQVLRQHSNTSSQTSKFTFPQSQEAFVEQMMHGQQHVVKPDTVSKIYEEPQRPGEKVLAVGAVWDYLQFKIEEEEYENIDMVEVMMALKGNEVCHGYGPAYPLELVDEALQRVADKMNAL